MFVSIVIPTYNNAAILRKTLCALGNQTYPGDQYEIIVVDDASTDGTDALFASPAPFGGAKYIRLPRNVGDAAARNVGVQATSGDILIFLDADNVPCRAFVEEHVKVHLQGTDVFVLGNSRMVKHLVSESQFIRYVDSRQIGARMARRRPPVDPSNLPYWAFQNANASLKREQWERVGGYDDTLTGYGGKDDELGYRLQQCGYRLVFARDAISCHIHRHTLNRACRNYFEMARSNYQIIKRKHPDFFERCPFKYLESVDMHRDSFRVVLSKVLVQSVLRRWVAHLLKKVADALDEASGVLLPSPAYQYILAFYYLQGVRARAKLVHRE